MEVDSYPPGPSMSPGLVFYMYELPLLPLAAKYHVPTSEHDKIDKGRPNDINLPNLQVGTHSEPRKLSDYESTHKWSNKSNLLRRLHEQQKSSECVL